MSIGTNFWDLSWGGDQNDPFSDGWQNVSGDNPWKQALLDEIEMYTVYRFMDWGKTNNAEDEHVSGRWVDRTQKHDPRQRPMAWEWMIDLCNRMQRDLWVTVPHIADADYHRQLAQLIYDQLDPGLKCYVEWSNETWNGIFSQADYVIQKGAEEGLEESNQWYIGQKYHAWATLKLFKAFDDVFADAPQRLVKVMGGTTVHAFAETHIQCIQDPDCNTEGVEVDAYALAPYIGNGVDGAGNNALQEIEDQIQEGLTGIERVKGALENTGMDLITYEGGQHVVQNADVVNRDPGIYDLYMTYLEEMSNHFSLFMHYVHNGTFGNMAWGAKEYIGQPASEAHKFRALQDYIEQNPVPIGVRHFKDAEGEQQGRFHSFSREHFIMNTIFSRSSGLKTYNALGRSLTAHTTTTEHSFTNLPTGMYLIP
jgi:hypothetical protein